MDEAKKIQNPLPFTSKQRYLYLFIGIISLGIPFVAGFALAKLLMPETTDSVVTSKPTPTVSETTQTIDTDTYSVYPSFYQKSLSYFDDTVVVVTKNSPRKALILTAARKENSPNTFSQNTRVSYFDGDVWTRQTESVTNTEGEISPTSINPQWDILVHSSLLLKEKSHISLSLTDSLELTTSELENEIVLRSFPWDTKFMSTGEGKLSINGRSEDVHIAYIRRYSQNTQGLQFYDSSLKSATDWLIYWDTEGNLYHIDLTSVQNPNDKYQSHTLITKVDSKKRVTRSFEGNVVRNSDQDPTHYAFTLGNPINEQLSIDRINVYDKAKGSATTDVIGLVTGILNNNSTSGYGFIQYLRD